MSDHTISNEVPYLRVPVAFSKTFTGTEEAQPPPNSGEWQDVRSPCGHFWLVIDTIYSGGMWFWIDTGGASGCFKAIIGRAYKVELYGGTLRVAAASATAAVASKVDLMFFDGNKAPPSNYSNAARNAVVTI